MQTVLGLSAFHLEWFIAHLGENHLFFFLKGSKTSFVCLKPGPLTTRNNLCQSCCLRLNMPAKLQTLVSDHGKRDAKYDSACSHSGGWSIAIVWVNKSNLVFFSSRKWPRTLFWLTNDQIIRKEKVTIERLTDFSIPFFHCCDDTEDWGRKYWIELHHLLTWN